MKSYSSATTIYSIQADDTIKTIAYKFQTTPQQLIKLNGNQPIFIQKCYLIRPPFSSSKRSRRHRRGKYEESSHSV